MLKSPAVILLSGAREGITTNKIISHRKVNYLHNDALPLGSNGSSKPSAPAAMIKAPEIYTGTAVCRFAYNAIIGAWRLNCEYQLSRT